MFIRAKTLSTLAAAALFASTAQADDLWSIYQQAIHADPVILQSAAQRDRAVEAVTSSRAPLLPQIGFSADYAIQSSDNDTVKPLVESQGYSYGVQLNQQIYNRATWKSLTQTEKTAHLAEVSHSAKLQNLLVRVSDAYFQVLQTQDQLEFTQATKRAIARQLEQTKQRFEVGLTAITDVHEAQAEYDLSTANEILAQNDVQNAYEGLRAITGQSYAQVNVLDKQRFSASPIAPASPQEWVKVAEDKNLSLNAARVSVDIAKSAVDVASASHWPTFDLFANYQRQNPEKGSFEDLGEYGTYGLGVQMNFNIYSGGGISSQVRQANFYYVEASEQLNETNRTVYKQVFDAYNAVLASVSSVTAYEQAVVSRQSALEATTAGFEVGTRTIVDVLNSTRSLFEAKNNLSRARYAYILNVLRLRQAAGTLSEQDLMDVNKGLMAPVQS